MPTTNTTTTDKVLHESRVESPVQFVRKFVVANGKKLGRAETIRRLVAKGIATHTARTQYQVVHANGYKLPGTKVAAKATKARKPKAPAKTEQVSAAA